MLKPRPLTPGSRVAVVAPASSFKREEFDAGVAEIARLGFVPVYDDSVFAKGIPPYVAGSPEIRAKAIRSALADPLIDGIIAVRGGYGSAQIIPLLDVGEIRRAAKPFVGYSDLTAVLNFLAIQCGLVSFHGPMLDECLSRGESKYDRASFLNALCRPSPLGELNGCDEPNGVLTGRAVMTALLSDFPGPVLIGFPSGHTKGPVYTLPFGVSCRVVANGRPALVIEEAAVQER